MPSSCRMCAKACGREAVGTHACQEKVALVVVIRGLHELRYELGTMGILVGQ